MKKLMILAGMLAALLVVAAPAFGQEDPYPEEDLQPPPEITVTGVLEGPVTPEETFPEYLIVDEASGQEWRLVSKASEGGVDLSQYVGQRVKINGGIPQTLGPVPDPLPEDYDLTQYPLFVPEGTLETIGDGNEQGRTIYGTAGSDNLTDTAGDDTVYALGSGDTVSAGNGDDELYGGTGWDYVGGGKGSDTLYGWRGSDWLDGGAGSDFVYGWTGDDLVDGGSGNDEVYGGVGDDNVYGYNGSDLLSGWKGNDYLYSAGDGTYDAVYGGSGYDVCVVGPEDSAYGCEELYSQ